MEGHAGPLTTAWRRSGRCPILRDVHISRRYSALLAVPALTLAACGGGGGKSDEDTIKDIVNGFAKDPATLCDHLTPELLKGVGGTKAKCVEASKAGKKNQKIDITKVDVSGSKATVTVKDKTGTSSLKMVKADDTWQVSG